MRQKLSYSCTVGIKLSLEESNPRTLCQVEGMVFHGILKEKAYLLILQLDLKLKEKLFTMVGLAVQ